jgi:hypothetical protein
MDVYRNFRKHFPSHLMEITLKKRQHDVKPDTKDMEPASPSSSKSKAKQSLSDVQLGLQKLVLSVPDASGTSERHLIRLFVIPSTSGLAAGYTVCRYREYVSFTVPTIPRLHRRMRIE